MEIIKKFKDEHGNVATIDYHTGPAYRGGENVDLYRLNIHAAYDDNYLFHVSVYETLDEAMKELSKSFSCTFKEISL